MLSDRPYMRNDYPRQSTNVLIWLIAAIIAGFFLQFVFLRWFNAGGALEGLFVLSPANIKAGKLWTLLTYSLLHDTGNLLHIVANLLGLYFLGRVLQPMLGNTRFCWVYAGSVMAGGVLWLATNWHGGGGLIGASAGVMGLFIVFACFYPDQPMTFLLFFIVPVTLKPRHVAIGAVLFELAGFGFYEIMGTASPLGSSIAHSAHLGGMAAGWIYFRYLHEASWRRPFRHVDVELPRWARRGAKASPAAPTYKVNVSSRDNLRAEVDRVLDKINSQGFGTLSPDEKRVLDEAKDLLSRR